MSVRDYLAIAREYEDHVLDGQVSACQWVRLACQRNRHDRERSEQHDPTFPFRVDQTAATRICATAELLPHIKGPNAVIIGQDDEGRARWATIHLEPWQCWLLTTLFGWLHRETGLRRFRVALVQVPRKNAKSTVAAAVVAYMLTSDGEGGAECYSAATTRDQAKVVAEIVWEMAKRSPAFREYFGVRLGAKTTRVLEVPSTASRFSPLSADAHTLDALNVSLAVVDELHAHHTRAVWDVLDTATGARLQPLMLATTTAGSSLAGICAEKRDYLRKVLQGVIADEAFFGVEYTIDEGDDWRDEATWRKANPNYGVSVQPDDLQRKAREAEHSPSAINNFLTKHLNVWVRSESTWMSMTDWMACGDGSLRMTDFVGVPCWIGVDLAENRDIAAVVAIFRPDAKRYVVFGRYYLPELAVQRSPIAQYSGWVRTGHLIETDGDQADYLRIEDDLVSWCETYAVQEIDFDRALAAQMGQSLKRRLHARMGKDAVERFVLTVAQTTEVMNPAMTLVERLVVSRELQHDANPCLAWMFSNVVVERNYKDEIYPRKAGGKDSFNKIDGPVALFTGISRACLVEVGAPRRKRKPVSVWTPQGFTATPATRDQGEAVP